MCSIGSFDTLSLINTRAALSNEPNAGYDKIGAEGNGQTHLRRIHDNVDSCAQPRRPVATESCCSPFLLGPCSAGDYASEKEDYLKRGEYATGKAPQTQTDAKASLSTSAVTIRFTYSTQSTILGVIALVIDLMRKCGNEV